MYPLPQQALPAGGQVGLSVSRPFRTRLVHTLPASFVSTVVIYGTYWARKKGYLYEALTKEKLTDT